MLKVGICGTSGAGKGYVCEKFKKYGAVHIDTDKVYREIAVPGSACLSEIKAFFGNEVINKDGTLNRVELSKKVFDSKNPAHLQILNKITHKHINKRVIELIEENEKKGKKIVLIDVPLMFESEFNKMCDVVICVTADYETKIQRIMKRDKITREKAEKRLRSQMSDDELRKLSDYEIVNDSKRDVTAQVSDLAKKLFKV